MFSAFGLRGIRAVDAVSPNCISSPRCITGPLLSPLHHRLLPDFTDFLPIFRTFLGDFGHQKLPLTRLSALLFRYYSIGFIHRRLIRILYAIPRIARQDLNISFLHIRRSISSQIREYACACARGTNHSRHESRGHVVEVLLDGVDLGDGLEGFVACGAES